MISAMDLTAVLTGINLLILLALMCIYGKNWKRIHSGFTSGLFIFALLFVLQHVITIYFYITMMEYYSPQVTTNVLIQAILQTIAFGTLLYITWR
ncbi:MAG: hypothetical protein Q8Q42_02845 [Nanoarchaeota archaeon]|nr:hypothetical protein [Nanoarchaeota archaeon]